jgi:hypothetical protein
MQHGYNLQQAIFTFQLFEDETATTINSNVASIADGTLTISPGS